MVTIDSRQVSRGSIFFAIRGDRFDGNDYAAAALEAGASFAVVDRPETAAGDRFLLVEDALLSLQQLARQHRRQFQIPVIAITGSNGKTTTKELVSAVLASRYSLHFTRGNLNNHIGVPLTLLAMRPETEVAVIEMGANHVGEIDALCRIAEPTHGLITNIGKAHLEGFGGLEGVRRGKSELYRYLASRDGVAFINKDEKHLEDLAQPVQKKLFYSRAASIGPASGPYAVELTAEQPFVCAAFGDENGDRWEVHSHLVGLYNFSNIMTAIALGKYFKVPARKIKMAVEGYVPSNNRSQVLVRGSNTFLLDAYNANPTSMRSAIDSFRKQEAAHKIAILGEMLELGQYSAEEHEQVARHALGQDFDEILLVGEGFHAIAGKLNLKHFRDAGELKAWLSAQHYEHAHFLLKGSRGIRLERILE